MVSTYDMGQFGTVKNKIIEVSFSCVYPVMDHEFHHNIVKVAVDLQGNGGVDLQTTLTTL